MRFDTKIAIAVLDELAVWQRLNMTAFLASAIAGAVPEVIGEPYRDASGNDYLPMFRQPVLVFAGGRDGLRKAWQRARERGLRLAVFTEELFTTGNDNDNRAAVRAVPAEKLALTGLALYGPRGDVDRCVRDLSLHS